MASCESSSEESKSLNVSSSDSLSTGCVMSVLTALSLRNSYSTVAVDTNTYPWYSGLRLIESPISQLNWVKIPWNQSDPIKRGYCIEIVYVANQLTEVKGSTEIVGFVEYRRLQ